MELANSHSDGGFRVHKCTLRAESDHLLDHDLTMRLWPRAGKVSDADHS
jgi:hypothetical protein